MKRFFCLLLLAVLFLPLSRGLCAKQSEAMTAVLAMLEANPAQSDISAYPLTGQEMDSLTALYPDTDFIYTISMYGLSFSGDTEVIDFGDTKVKNIKQLQAALPYFPMLTEVDMYESNIGRKNMEALWSAYPSIHWGWTLKLGSHVIRTDIEAFSSLHSPTNTHYSSSYYEPLKYCWQLKALDLGHNKLTDISFIGTMTDLRVLILADNRIKDITPLSNLKKLQYVELFMNYITDLSPLAGAPELLDLNLCHGSFSDLEAVYTMPKLQRLWVTKHKKMSEGYLDELKANLPGVEVYVDGSGSTGGTWRTHERYYIIYEMFNTYTYIPFPETDESL